VIAASSLQRTLLELLLVAVVAWLAATAVSGVTRLLLEDAPIAQPVEATPVPPAIEPLDAFQTIATRDVFNAGAPKATGTAPAVRLWGVGMHGEDAYAVIEDPATREQRLQRVGDEIGGARITAIAWDRVTLRDADGEHTLLLTTEPGVADADAGRAGLPPGGIPPAAPDVPVRQTGPDSYIVDRGALTGAVDNTSGLLTQLRAVPEVSEGRPIGFRLFQINPQSVFARLGIRNGDVVQRVNGSTLADPASLLGFLQRLQNEPRVALDIVRGGQPHTLVYDLR
jgi:general secretion pathway protein C